MSRAVLAIRQEPTLPEDLGRLLSAEQVANELLGGHKSERWVRRYMGSPEAGRLVLGHRSVFWYENLAKAWLARKVSP